MPKPNSTVARMAGNIVGAMLQVEDNALPEDRIGYERIVQSAVQLARDLLAEVERTEPPVDTAPLPPRDLEARW